jgi:hypothetical protein
MSAKRSVVVVTYTLANVRYFPHAGKEFRAVFGGISLVFAVGDSKFAKAMLRHAGES